MTRREQLDDEALRLRKIRQVVDIATNLIMQSSLSREEAERLVTLVRDRVLELFPDGEQTFELIYTPRFRRLIDEFALPGFRHPAVVLPFHLRHS